MIKITKKVEFSPQDNKMNSVANTSKARELYYSSKSLNVKFLLEKRFSWMNNFIKEEDVGIEVGSGAGFLKDYIKNKNLKLTDLGNDSHLDNMHQELHSPHLLFCTQPLFLAIYFCRPYN